MGKTIRAVPDPGMGFGGRLLLAFSLVAACILVAGLVAWTAFESLGSVIISFHHHVPVGDQHLLATNDGADGDSVGKLDLVQAPAPRVQRGRVLRRGGGEQPRRVEEDGIVLRHEGRDVFRKSIRSVVVAPVG